jgi:hypothetical protein
MSSIKISKNYLYQILFAICVGVTYLNNYELTFVVWCAVILFTIKQKYSLTLINFIFPYIAILIVAIISSFFYDYTVYEIIRDITYLLKPIVGLILGYQLCRNADMKVIKTIIYVGFIISIIHLGIILYSAVIHRIINIHELRKYSGYFSDFEVYAFILVLFHKKFDIVFSKQRFLLLLIVIGISSALYVSRANFIQAFLFYLVLKGYFSLNKRMLIVLFSLIAVLGISYAVIYNMNFSRNGKGLEGLLYKIKNAPIEAFKTKVNKDDWRDFNDNYRAYENILAVQNVTYDGFWTTLRGKGLGSEIQLGQKLYTNDGTVLTEISILHNAFMTVFLKSGLIGVFFMIYFLRLLTKQNPSNLHAVNQLNLILIATGIYLLFDNWVLLGLYLKTESKAIIIGFILAYKELLIKKANQPKVTA